MIDKVRYQLKSLKHKAIGTYKHLKPTIACKPEWFGSLYGGFYVIPELLDFSSIVYSFGIGQDISFDRKIIETYRCQVFGFDPTPKSIEWVKDQDIPSEFHFNPYGLGKQSEWVEFFLPQNDEYVSGSMVKQTNIDQNRAIKVEMKSLSDIVKELGHRKIDVLKIDIEGSEYEVIETLFETGVEIRQILIEFHDRFFNEKPLPSATATQRMNHHGYEIFGVSNTFEEVSFVLTNALK